MKETRHAPLSTREALARFQRGYRVARIDNVNRREAGALPPLMEDVRATNLLEYKPEGDITIYLKAVGSPYTGEHGIHFLTIPDRSDHEDIPGIADLGMVDLSGVLRFVESVSHAAFEQPGISEVDFGWHHSRGEATRIPKQRQSTFPRNLHVHIIAFAEEDMKPVTLDEVMASADLAGKTGEALHKLGEELLFGEMVPELKEEFPMFDDFFEETRDMRGRRRFKMLGGRESFANPYLANILQEMDDLGDYLYGELADCFFEFDLEKQVYVTKDVEYARYIPLPLSERRSRVSEYLEAKPWLSDGVKLGLMWLAGHAKTAEEILSRAGGVRSISDVTNRFWAYKDFSYSMSFSAKKSSEGQEPEWVFAFDPKVFSVEGIVQSSAFTDKWIVRDTLRSYTPDQLSAVQVREQRVVDQVLQEHPEFKVGPGIALGV